MRERVRRRVERVRRGLRVLSLVARDPRTPWHARLVGALTLAYALSPIDLVPDFVPVLGLLDDLVVVPLGAWLALRLTPAAVVADARARAEAGGAVSGRRWLGALLVLLAWAALVVLAWWLLKRSLGT